MLYLKALILSELFFTLAYYIERFTGAISPLHGRLTLHVVVINVRRIHQLKSRCLTTFPPLKVKVKIDIYIISETKIRRNVGAFK